MRAAPASPAPAVPPRDNWTALRLAGAAPLARAQAGDLPALLRKVTASEGAGSRSRDASEFAASPAVRIELMQGARVVAVLEIANGRWQWRQAPAEAGGAVDSTGESAASAANANASGGASAAGALAVPADSGPVDAATLAALRAELARLGLAR